LVKVIEDEEYKKLENKVTLFFGFLFGMLGVIIRSCMPTELSIGFLAFVLAILMTMGSRVNKNGK